MKTENQNELTALVRKQRQMSDRTMTKQILLTRRSPAYWRVTFNHPPLNIFGPETIPQLNEIITALETDEHVKVVVFDSAVLGFFLTHGAEAYRKDVPAAEVHILDAGHFALDEQASEVIRLTQGFMDRRQ
jgi:enoyl-CoA hydratase/carnithine racemase